MQNLEGMIGKLRMWRRRRRIVFLSVILALLLGLIVAGFAVVVVSVTTPSLTEQPVSQLDLQRLQTRSFGVASLTGMLYLLAALIGYLGAQLIIEVTGRPRDRLLVAMWDRIKQLEAKVGA